MDYLLCSLSEDTFDKLFPNMMKSTNADMISRAADGRLKIVLLSCNRERENTISALDDLNIRKSNLLVNEIANFVDAFQKIKNIDYQEASDISEYHFAEFSLSDYQSMQQEVFDFQSFIKTSILSYTLGGFLIGGIIMHQKAETLMNQALTHTHEIDIECEKLETSKMEMHAIQKLARQENKLLRKLTRLVKEPLNDFSDLTTVKSDWQSFTIEEKKQTAALMNVMKLLKLLIEQPIITDQGDLNENAQQLLKKDSVFESVVNTNAL